MAGSTIGTNIITDGSTEYELLKALLNEIEKILEEKGDNEYVKNLKFLAARLDGGGKLNYKLVQNKYVKELKDGLRNANIPYILMPNECGQTAIVVRDKDSQKFLEIQQRIFSRYTDYWKEQAVDNMVKNIETDPEYHRSKIPVLTFEDNAMRLICAQKLYGNSVVTGYMDGKTIVHPTSAYNKSGDLVDVQLDMAMEQAKGDGYTGYNLLDIRKEQAKYDQETLSLFCRAFKDKKSISLWDASGRSKTGLSINRDGDIELCTPQAGYEHFSGEDNVRRVVIAKAGDSISETELFGMLSKHAADIYNMVCCTTSERDDVLSGKRKLPCSRPHYEVNSDEQFIYDDIRGGLQAALDAVKGEACRYVEEKASKIAGREEKARMKEKQITEILTNRSHPMIQRWLNAEVKSKDSDCILTRAEKEAFLDKLIGHFKDNYENSRDVMRIDTYSVRDIKKLFAEKEAVPCSEKDKENERE